MLFLLSLHSLLPFLHYTLFDGHSLLCLSQGLHEGINTPLIVIKLEKAELQLAFIELLQQCLIFLCLNR